MAESLGKKLLGDVEEVGLNEIYRLLRRREETEFANHFGFQPLDRLVRIVTETRPSKLVASPLIIEFTSVAPGGGKTHLLYHLIAKAVLPLHLGGKQASVVIIDTENAFSIARLAQQLNLQIRTHKPHNSTEDNETAQNSNEILLTALTHVHFFRPQTLPSLIATLHSLPSYLFDSTAHKSFDRRLSFIALDSASAFSWQARADGEHASYTASTKNPHKQTPKPPSNTSTNLPKTPSTLPTYTTLTTALKLQSSILEIPILITAQNTTPIPTSGINAHNGEIRTLRPTLPAPLSQIPSLRLIVQRIKVRKLPVGISVEEARDEGENRQRVVDEGRFNCVVNEWGLDERTLQSMQQIGAGVGFQIMDEGVLFDE